MLIRLLFLILASVFATALGARAQAPIPPVQRPPDLHLVWEQDYEHGIGGHDSFAALDVALSGEIYVVGSSLGLVGSYTYEIVTLKYSADGTRQWERRYDPAVPATIGP
mgnify:FL=1